MKIETKQIPANNEAGYVIVNVEDEGSEATAKWAKGVSKVKLATFESDEAETKAGDKAETKEKAK